MLVDLIVRHDDDHCRASLSVFLLQRNDEYIAQLHVTTILAASAEEMIQEKIETSSQSLFRMQRLS